MKTYEQIADRLTLANRYYAMRHGESWANRQGIIVSHPDVGNGPAFGLTGDGRRQVMRSALRSGLSSETLLYSSPFSRTFETATTVKSCIGARAVSLAWELRERDFGELEGKSVSNYEHVWFRDSLGCEDEYLGVETAGAVALRGLELIMKLEEEHSDEDILLVSHGDTLQILETAFRGKSAAEHRSLPPLALAEIRRL